MEVRHPPPPNTHFSYKALRQQLFHDPASESWTLRVSAEDDCRPVLTSHSQSTRICQSFLYPFEMCLAIQEYLSSGLGNHILKWNHPEKWSHVSLFHGGGGHSRWLIPGPVSLSISNQPPFNTTWHPRSLCLCPRCLPVLECLPLHHCILNGPTSLQIQRQTLVSAIQY